MLIQMIGKSYLGVGLLTHVRTHSWPAHLEIHGPFDPIVFQEKGMYINAAFLDGTFKTN